jgi:hypothetical protein
MDAFIEKALFAKPQPGKSDHLAAGLAKCKLEKCSR